MKNSVLIDKNGKIPHSILQLWGKLDFLHIFLRPWNRRISLGMKEGTS